MAKPTTIVTVFLTIWCTCAMFALYTINKFFSQSNLSMFRTNVSLRHSDHQKNSNFQTDRRESSSLDPHSDLLGETKLLVHTYHEGNLHPGFELMFKAFLVTQNLDRIKLVQWVDEDWGSDKASIDKQEIYSLYGSHPNIDFRMLDHRLIAKNTCFEERPEYLDRHSIEKFGLRDWTNVMRLLLIFQYGGIWIDSDTIPLQDFTFILGNNPTNIVAGLAKDVNEPENKEKGFFNNNFLFANCNNARNQLIDAACQFRRYPKDVDWKSKEGIKKLEFQNIIPLMGEDKHELHVMNHWLFNDGTLRLCWIRESCPLKDIGLGEIDPIWLRTLDMYAICERVRQSMRGYAASFTKLILNKGYVNTTKYLSLFDWTKHVYVVHTRASHCRTFKMSPIGMLNYFRYKVDKRVENIKSILDIPKEPMDVMSYDYNEIMQPSHRIKFFTYVVVIESKYAEFEQRKVIRALYNNPAWYSDGIYDSVSRFFKVFFVIPYDNRNDEFNGNLHTELDHYDDVILVEPKTAKQTKEEFTKGSAISTTLTHGILKILNNYDFRYIVVLKSLKVFVNIRNLIYLMNDASNHAVFYKETRVTSFVITHNLDGQSDTDGQTTLLHKNNEQKFIVFTRDLLSSILGLETESGLSPDSNLSSSYFSMTSQVETIEVAKTRLGLSPQLLEKKPKKPVGVDDFSLKENMTRSANTAEFFGFWATPYTSQKMSKFKKDFESSNKHSECEVVETQFVYDYPATSSIVGAEIEAFLLHPNTTFIWDVPCEDAMWSLFKVSKHLPQIKGKYY